MRLKCTLLELLVIIAICGVLIALVIPGADQDRSHKYPFSVVPGINLARVAGDYYLGSGRGWNWHLSVLPDGRYSYVSSGCTGVDHREAGQAREVQGLLILTPEKANTKNIPRVLLPVRWDQRSYLIRHDELPKFCEAILSGVEPRDDLHGNNYLDGLGRADGLPELPEEWLASLRPGRTTGKILEAGEEGSWARVALGGRQGLKVGDRLRVQGEPGHEVEVKAVDDDSCLVLALEIGGKIDVLKVGQNVVITRPEITAPELR